MNPHRNPKLSQRQKEQAAAKSHATGVNQAVALEFNNPEELLRHDAAQAEVPARVAERLQESIRKEPPPPKGWWARLFGGQ